MFKQNDRTRIVMVAARSGHGCAVEETAAQEPGKSGL
jgi:hypothetical protein